jgi:DNA-binding NtrC family response regulator
MEKRNILFVDDDIACLQLFKGIVEQLEVKAEYAASGEEALGMLMKACFAIMITDLNMQGMDGFELALMAKEFQPQMKIVMVTGAVSPDIYRLAAEIGISRVLTKPFDISLIMEILVDARYRRDL